MTDNVYDKRMSKITFRADDDLVDQLEAFDASKSEVMREALREYLGESAESARNADTVASTTDEGSLDELLVERVDAIIDERLDRAFTRRQPQDINVNISLDGDATAADDAAVDATPNRDDASHEASTDASHSDDVRKTPRPTSENADAEGTTTCAKCGESLSDNHVYCPNCGEKTSHRVFCECGDEIRSDWSFCPSCGRRTPAADVLDNP
jgi:predicted transcriptional regulator